VASLHLDKRDGKASFAATFLDRLAGLIALSLFAIVGGIIIFVLNIQQNKQFFMVLGVLSLFVGIFFGFFIILLSRRLQNALRILLQRLPAFPSKGLIQNVLEETFINRRGKEDKRMLIQVGFLSLIIQSLRILVNIFAAQALGIFSFSTLHYFFVIIPIVALMVTVPMPFGVRETVGGICFGLAGFSVDQSVVMLFLATIVCVAGSLIGGVWFLLDRKTKAERRTLTEDTVP
jgi:MFS family permease